MAYSYTVFVEEDNQPAARGRSHPDVATDRARWRTCRVFYDLDEALQWIVDHCDRDPRLFRARTELHRVPEAFPLAPPAAAGPAYDGVEVAIEVEEKAEPVRRQTLRRPRGRWSWLHRVSSASHPEAIGWIARNVGGTQLTHFRVVSRLLALPSGPSILAARRVATTAYEVLTERGDLECVTDLLLDLMRCDRVIAGYFATHEAERLREHVVTYLIYATGGGQALDAALMSVRHRELRVTQEAWDRMAGLLAEALMRMGFDPTVRAMVTSAVRPLHGCIVTGARPEADQRHPELPPFAVAAARLEAGKRGRAV